LTAGRLRRRFATGHVPMSTPFFPSVFVSIAVIASVIGSSAAAGLVPASGFLD